MYYAQNIEITEDTTRRPLLVAETITSLGLGLLTAVPLFPLALINDLGYAERKYKNMGLLDAYIPHSMYVACGLTQPRIRIRKLDAEKHPTT